MKRIVIILTVVLFVSPAYSHQITGEDLLNGCRSIINQTKGAKLEGATLTQAVFYLGYLNGFTEANETMERNNLYCVPQEGLEAEQTALIVISYLEGKLSKLHEDAKDLTLEALMNAFPCEK